MSKLYCTLCLVEMSALQHYSLFDEVHRTKQLHRRWGQLFNFVPVEMC